MHIRDSIYILHLLDKRSLKLEWNILVYIAAPSPFLEVSFLSLFPFISLIKIYYLYFSDRFQDVQFPPS